MRTIQKTGEDFALDFITEMSEMRQIAKRKKEVSFVKDNAF